MNYEKLSPEKFTEKLKNKEYQDLTGARRAIGKASWAETAKATARTQAEKFFGVPGNAKPAVKKTAAKPAKKVAAKPAVKAKSVHGSKVVKQKRASHVEHPVAGVAAPHAVPKSLTIADIRKNPFSIIQLAEHAVASGTTVLNAATEMKKQDNTINVSELTASAVATIRGGLDLAAKVITSLSEGIETPKAVTDVIANGASHIEAPTEGEPIYTGPAAEA